MDKKDKEIDLTPEEFDKIKKALKDETFRKLLHEYAEEISDPENRKKREEEIAMLEKGRGMDVKFVKPQAGYVIKTVNMEDNMKIFINMCSSDQVEEATVKDEIREGKAGKGWSIPFITTPPREDLDKAGKKCHVVDILFHSETFEMGKQNERFKKLLIDTALNDGLENQLNITVDKNNLKFPKMKYKGQPTSSLLRRPMEKDPPKAPDDDILKFPFPPSESESFAFKEGKNERSNKQDVARNSIKPTSNNQSLPKGSQIKEGRTTPKHKIIHRGHVDFQNFTMARDSNSRTRPQELIVEIELPLANSAAGMDLDIFEKRLVLDSTSPNYYLDISLPYPVNEDNGKAQFDKSAKKLVVTLPVTEMQSPSILHQDDKQPSTIEQEISGCKESKPCNKQGDRINAGFTSPNLEDSAAEKCHDLKQDDAEDSQRSSSKEKQKLPLTDFDKTCVNSSGKNLPGKQQECVNKSCYERLSDKKTADVDESQLTLNNKRQYLEDQQLGKQQQENHLSHLVTDVSVENLSENKEKSALDQRQQQENEEIQLTENTLVGLNRSERLKEIDRGSKETSNLILSSPHQLLKTNEKNIALRQATYCDLGSKNKLTRGESNEGSDLSSRDIKIQLNFEKSKEHFYECSSDETLRLSKEGGRLDFVEKLEAEAEDSFSNDNCYFVENCGNCKSNVTCKCFEGDTANDVENLKLMDGIPGMYKLPPYTYEQDEYSIRIDIRISNVKMERVSMGFHEQQVYFSCPSNPRDIRSPYWCLFLKFVDSCKLEPDGCTIDLEQDKVVLFLQKADSSSYIWKKFFVGYTEQNLKDEFFATEDDDMSESLDQANMSCSLASTSGHKDSELKKNFAFIDLEGQLDRLLREQESRFSHTKDDVFSDKDDGDTVSSNKHDSVSQNSSNEIDSIASDLKINVTLDELQDDVIVDETSTKDAALLSRLPVERSSSVDTVHLEIPLRPIIKRSKSESYADCESWDYLRLDSATLSDECLYSMDRTSDFQRKKTKSVSFDPEPTVFEFVELSKKQLKKMRKAERKQEAFALFRKGSFNKKGKNKKGEKDKGQPAADVKNEQIKGEINEKVKGQRDEKAMDEANVKLQSQLDTGSELSDSNSKPPITDSKQDNPQSLKQKQKAMEDVLTSPKKHKKKKKRNRFQRNSSSEGEQSCDDTKSEHSNELDKKENGFALSNSLIFELDE